MRQPVIISILIGVLTALGSRDGASQQASKPGNPGIEETLRKSQIVAGNIQTAINSHILDDPDFRQSKQLPEDPQNHPKVLVFKDGSFAFDWTHGQEARYLMEEMRQGVHALQSVNKPRGMDIIALTGAREYWPKLRDISCGENPGIRYYDLDGFEEYCPAK